MSKIRRSRDRLILNMGIPILGEEGLCIETGPMAPDSYRNDVRFLYYTLSVLRTNDKTHLL